MSITITKHMAFKSGGKSLTVYRDTDKNFYVTCDGLRSGDDIMTATFESDFTFVRKHEVPCELLKGQYISSEHFPIYGGTVNTVNISYGAGIGNGTSGTNANVTITLHFIYYCNNY